MAAPFLKDSLRLMEWFRTEAVKNVVALEPPEGVVGFGPLYGAKVIGENWGTMDGNDILMFTVQGRRDRK